ncbi:MAG: hypothetical protein L0154_10635 [Chloroflexi bacterium]|nr:hypothetical protein [Chloroflexota bacterium]
MSIIAGSISSLIFISGTLSMLVKAYRTRDMNSYSIVTLALNNIGNLIYWVYILSLPFGPIYLLHGFYTFTTAFMLCWGWLYRTRPEQVKRVTRTLRTITQTMELPVIRPRQ